MRGDIHRLRSPPGSRGHEQAGVRYAVVDSVGAREREILRPRYRSHPQPRSIGQAEANTAR